MPLALAKLACAHDRHEQPAGGRDASGEWSSAAAAAYPPGFNYFISRAVHSLRSSSFVPTPLAPSADPAREDTVENRAIDVGLAPRRGLPTDSAITGPAHEPPLLK